MSSLGNHTRNFPMQNDSHRIIGLCGRPHLKIDKSKEIDSISTGKWRKLESICKSLWQKCVKLTIFLKLDLGIIISNSLTQQTFSVCPWCHSSSVITSKCLTQKIYFMFYMTELMDSPLEGVSFQVSSLSCNYCLLFMSLHHEGAYTGVLYFHRNKMIPWKLRKYKGKVIIP